MNCMNCWKQNSTNACIAQYMNTCIALYLNTCIALDNKIRFSCHKWAPRRPTVSPAKNSLVYFILIAYIDHPVWRSHREEGKRGSPSGPRIPRNKEVMMSLLLPYATTGLSLIAGWGLSVGACCRFALSQPRMPYSCLLQKEEGMVRLPVLCPHCHGDQVIKGGKTTAGQQRYKCQSLSSL